MPSSLRRSRMLPRAAAACALLALPFAAAPSSAPASKSPNADAAGVKVANRIVRLARQELAKGVHEIPDGSNKAPAIHRYDQATTPHYYGAAWCAYFASYIAKRAGAPVGPGGRGLGYVPSIRAWAQATGRWTQRPRPGELITFPEHVGIVEAVYTSNHTLTSIEGNHGNAVHRVWHRWRESMGFVRLVGGNPSNPSPQKSPAPGNTPHTTLKARISAYPQTTVAPGQSIDFTSLDSSGNVTKSNWDLDGNGHYDTTGSSVTHRYDKPGRYVVRLKVTDAKKNTSTASATITVNDNRAPVAAIHIPTDVTVNQNVTATADGSYDPDGRIVRYDWDMNGDGNFGQDGTSHSYTYDRPGDYVAVVKVTDNDGNSASARATVHVHDYAGPQSRLTCSSGDVVSGTTVNCHADDSASPTPVTKHEWDMNDDGSYASGGADSSYNFPTPGNYTVHLRVTDAKGRQSESTVDVRVEDRAPLPSIVLPAKVVVDQPATIDGSGSSDPDGSVAAWEWDLDGDGSFDHSGPSPTITFDSWGTRTISLRVTDDWGVTATKSEQLRVLAPPVAAGVVTTASPAVNANVNFLPTGSSDPDGTIVKYQWDFNNDGAVDKTTTTAGTSTYWKWTVAGSYQVHLTVTDNDGVKAGVLIPVTVH